MTILAQSCIADAITRENHEWTVDNVPCADLNLSASVVANDHYRRSARKILTGCFGIDNPLETPAAALPLTLYGNPSRGHPNYRSRIAWRPLAVSARSIGGSKHFCADIGKEDAGNKPFHMVNGERIQQRIKFQLSISRHVSYMSMEYIYPVMKIAEPRT